MSSLLTQNAEALLRKLILLDMNDVANNRRQLLSSFYGMMLFLIKRLIKGCASASQNRYPQILVLQRLIANMPAALYRHALVLVSSGQCATAMIRLNQNIFRGHLPSRALKAWMLLDGREGVAKNYDKAIILAREGVRLGCHHCLGVLACCYHYQGNRRDCGIRQKAMRSLELAHKSSDTGSRYGQYALGKFLRDGIGGQEKKINQAVALFQLAADQGLDRAQFELGLAFHAQDRAEALRWYQLAAAQGHPEAMYGVAYCYDKGEGVAVNYTEAIWWLQRAQAANCFIAQLDLLDCVRK
jgi:TPR repeat protein